MPDLPKRMKPSEAEEYDGELISVPNIKNPDVKPDFENLKKEITKKI